MQDTCKNASEEGILDGQQPQSSAAASIIFVSTVRSYFEKMNMNISGKNNTKKNTNVDDLQTEKGDINIALTVETALATIGSVKKAYATLLLNANIVVPLGLKNRILQIIPEKDELYWSSGLPTFDILLKNQKSKSTKNEVGIEKEKLENQRMKERIERKGQSQNDLKIIQSNQIQKIKIEQNISHSTTRTSSTSTLPFSPSSSSSQRNTSPVALLADAVTVITSSAISVKPVIPETVKMTPIQNQKSVYSIVESDGIQQHMPLNKSDNDNIGQNEQNILHPKTVDRSGYMEENYGNSMKSIYTEKDFIHKNEKIKFIESVPDMNMNINRNLNGIDCETSNRKMQKIVK